jgi:Pyruvate/2-oxoacid:ferredoxin oxidoreductase gamma subunit
MIMVGALVAFTQIVSLDGVVAAMRAALPPHRAAMADTNAALIAEGAAWAREAGAGAA